MCYVQFCFFIGQNYRRFCALNILWRVLQRKNLILLFEKQTRRARHISIPVCSKRLNIAIYGYALRALPKLSSKICTRINAHNT